MMLLQCKGWCRRVSLRCSRVTVLVFRAEGFYAEIRKYWPDLPDGALVLCCYTVIVLL
jgi:hypothetical protein